VQNFVKKGVVNLSAEDEIVRDTMVTSGGDVSSPALRERLGMAAVTR
jgi:hypothetical protein